MIDMCNDAEVTDLTKGFHKVIRISYIWFDEKGCNNLSMHQSFYQIKVFQNK